MGIGIQGETERIEGFDLPDNYYTTVTYEDAGNGLVRVSRYVRKRGVLVPVVNTVSSAADLIQFGKEVSEFSRQLLQRKGTSH